MWQQKLKRVFFALIALLIISLFITAYIYLPKPTTLPIKTIKITGDYSHVSQQAIEKQILRDMPAGFLGVNLVTIQQSLLQLPWLAQVEARKIWPDTLLITLQQYKPIAQWGEKSLLADNGIIFTPADLTGLPVDLPQFVGPSSQGKVVLDTYLLMDQHLQHLQLKVVNITLSDRLSWTIKLSNGILLILGRENVVDRLQRFIDVYSQVIGNKANKVISVDLRYSQGLAIQWKR